MSRETAASASTPTHFGRYEVAALLATGGMAEVYLAKLVGPQRFERAVVVKRILPHLARDESFRTMFLDEARLAAWIHHPNVVTVHELAEADGELFLVMDYVEGETLAALLKRVSKAGHAVPLHVAVHVVAEACAGLHAAHELVDDQRQTRGIVHRDVSPQNLMIDYHGTVRVLDFGIASAVDRSTSTQSGVVKGKFAYMSPEQARAQKVDRQTDVFALGVVLYEVTTGSRLFARDNSLAVLHAICEEPLPSPRDRRPSYPRALEEVLMKALARDPKERYASAAELRRGLLGVLRDLDPEGRAPEDLAALMQTHFADRQIAKRDLLSRVTSDSHVTRAPGAPRSRVWLGAAALTLAAALGVFFALRTDEAAAVETANAPSAASSADANASNRAAPNGTASNRAASNGTASNGTASNRAASNGTASNNPASTGTTSSTAGTTDPAPPEAPARVRLEVSTSPPGATIALDGEPLGTSPLDLERPRDEQVHVLQITHEGFVTRSESWTADVDQRLRFELSPVEPVDPPSSSMSTSMRRRRPTKNRATEMSSSYFRL